MTRSSPPPASRYAVIVGNIHDQREDDTTADCSAHYIQPLNTRSYCILRSGHLDFGASRQGGKKGSKRRKVEEEGICSLCCKMASMQLKSDVMREAEEHSFMRSILINIAAEEYTFGSN